MAVCLSIPDVRLSQEPRDNVSMTLYLSGTESDSFEMSKVRFPVTYFTTLYLVSNQAHTQKEMGDSQQNLKKNCKAIRDLPSSRNQPLKSADGNKYIRIKKK